MKRNTVAGLLVLLPMLLLTGCAAWAPQDAKKSKGALETKTASKWKLPWSKKNEKPVPYPNPARMAVTWTPDTLVQSGRTPTRGFGGRLFFYDEKTRTVPVEGDLMIHAFAENPDGSMGEVKRYQFTSEQFTRHFSQSDLGASYSIWIPWDAVGGDQMKVSLVPSFKSTSGRVVQGETALVGLPGKRSETEAIARKRPDPTELLMAERESAISGMTTTTIPVRRPFDAQPNRRPGMGDSGERIATLRAGRPSLAERRSHTLSPLGNTSQGIEMASMPPEGSSQVVQAQALPEATPAPAPRPQRLGQGVTTAGAEFPVQ
jgi:hypothetical protein